MRVRPGFSGRLFLLATLAGACSSPASQAEKDAARLRSWTAATRMVVDAWASGRVTGPYASRTLEIGAQELSRAARSLDRHVGDGGEPRSGVQPAAQAAAAARAFRAHLAAARAAVQRADHAGAAAAAHLLAGDDAQLAAADRALKAAAR